MGIQRQVIRQQADTVVHQRFDAAVLHAGDTGVLPFPEITVMNQQHVGAGFDGPLDHGLAGGYPADHLVDRGPACDLQAIGAVIPEGRRSQQGVGQVDQLFQCYGHTGDNPFCN